MSEAAVPKEKCTSCGRAIELCAYCDDPGCPEAICYGCLSVALGQRMPQPHAHGG